MKFTKENQKVINTAINVLTVILFIAVIAPFFITIKYALFVTDDFPIANATISNFDGNYFTTGVKCAANYWHVWNGNWFSFIIAYWLHPLLHGGQKALVLALRIHLFWAFAGAIYFCISLSSFFDLKKDKTLRIMTLVMLPVLLFKEYFDFYLWWLTACTYLMPFYFFLFGFGTFLFAIKSNKPWQFVLSGVFLLAMSGGSLNVVGLGCFTLLFALVSWCIYTRKISIPGTIVFAITLVGACLNAFAPGGFARQNTQKTEKVGIVRALFNEIQIMGVEGKWLILHTAFIAFVLLALLWGSKIHKEISLRNLVVASIYCILLPVVTMFPVVLGYGDIDYKDISNRGYGMMDISIIFGACFMAVLWGIYLKNILKGKIRIACVALASLLAIINVAVCGQKPTELVPMQIASNIHAGFNEEFFETWMTIYSTCENSTERDVVITMSVPPRKAGCSWPKLGEDTDKWWNEYISIYYGIDSVSLINTYE